MPKDTRGIEVSPCSAQALEAANAYLADWLAIKRPSALDERLLHRG
ncbi:MAG: hypothetical protein AAGA45_05320 [Verrucomicrobiota bacterium]